MRSAIKTWGLWKRVACLQKPHTMHSARHTAGFRCIHEQPRCKRPHEELGSPHQQNVIWSGSLMQSSQTLRATSPMLPSTSSCSQTPLELSKVLSDSPRAISGAPESTCSYGGTFRMLWNLTYRIVKFWSSWDLWADLWETSREAGTTAQLCGILRDRLRPRLSSAGDLMPYSHSSGSDITTRHFVLSYPSLLQSQDLLHHNMACII